MKQMVKLFEDRFPFDELSIRVVQKMVRGNKQHLASISIDNLLNSKYMFLVGCRQGMTDMDNKRA